MIIFDSYIEGAQGFPVRIREAFYRAVVEYLYFEREPEGLPAEAMGLFTMIRPNLDESIRKSKAGKLGASRRQSSAKAVDAEERQEEPAELQQAVPEAVPEAVPGAVPQAVQEAIPQAVPQADALDCCQANGLAKSKSKSKSKDIKPLTPKAPYEEIVGYLNASLGTTYRPTSKKTQSLINARLSEGFAADDFKAVIDSKLAEWGNDAKMRQFLRPETLFGTKFESYLQSPRAKGGGRYAKYA